MFQFLIGRLKTLLTLAIVAYKSGFQFLIGRLKTIAENNFKDSLERLFEFLIGRLKTRP